MGNLFRKGVALLDKATFGLVAESSAQRPDGGRGILPVGAITPDLVGVNAAGNTVRLSEQTARSLVYFYPKDDTPGCTREACAIRDAWADFVARGLTVFGVSGGDDASHAAFRAKYNLPFVLVSDADGSVRRAFGVGHVFGLPARVSFLVAGGTGAGKTTLLNALSGAIPADERIVTIEDSAELLLQHAHVVSMETRQANSEGRGAVTTRDLVRNSLRMRPDRILVGEVRGPEALDMLQVMNTGHEGSLSTIHANDTRDALARLEMMVAMSGFELPIPVVREYIASGIKLVVHVARLKGGVRRVMRVTEIQSAQRGEFQLQDVFEFQQQGLDDKGRAKGTFRATGYRPQCLTRFADAGIQVADSLFENPGETDSTRP